MYVERVAVAEVSLQIFFCVVQMISTKNVVSTAREFPLILFVESCLGRKDILASFSGLKEGVLENKHDSKRKQSTSRTT